MPRALIVEDDPLAREAVEECARLCGFRVTAVGDREAATQELHEGDFAVAVLDLFLPDGTGFDVLLEAKSISGMHTILVTGDVTTAEAFATGGLRFGKIMAKPVDYNALEKVLRQAHADWNESRLSGRTGVDRLIGSSAAMEHVRDLVKRAGPTDYSVYIQGESGTGKELVARAIHEHSPRSASPFVALNCGAVPESLIDSQLFGHERGSFTGANRRAEGLFEQAEGGTLFLDEITEMPLELQTRLLRALEERHIRRVGGTEDIPIDVRIVSATNRDFQSAMESGHLREDLFYRLCVMPITLPPLRARESDRIELARHFLGEQERAVGRTLELSAEAEAALESQHMPGNVRQLRNAIQRASVLADHVIGPEHLEELTPRSMAASDPRQLELRIGDSIADAERRLIEATLRHEDGDKRAAAEMLGVSLRTLYNRLNEYKQEDADSKSSSSSPE